jgi:hypothetical protein
MRWWLCVVPLLSSVATPLAPQPSGALGVRVAVLSPARLQLGLLGEVTVAPTGRGRAQVAVPIDLSANTDWQLTVTSEATALRIAVVRPVAAVVGASSVVVAGGSSGHYAIDLELDVAGLSPGSAVVPVILTLVSRTSDTSTTIRVTIRLPVTPPVDPPALSRQPE